MRAGTSTTAPARARVARTRTTTTTPRRGTTTTTRAMKRATTVEEQRRRAKEMVTYFKDRRYDDALEESQVFGWTAKNEINNGRWTMFGLLVGMMTEYGTGVDFVDQIKLLVSVLGIADVYD
ncbi:unnamed product [Ostreococcus tauri]|uniref:Unnamed product n=1 Tax=Ostreococcus tauri TaxID=70448 RepID=A0A090M7Z1_OSTTA|nr:unnamed product [Ostreococcus tauri]CEG01158.1 unnamed product [Ostreococcus tauri]|eukprot:XP_003075235.2 unnamed product [Ostreococcus tauri]